MPKKTVSIVGAIGIAFGVLSFSVVDAPVVLQADHSVSIKNLQFNPQTMDMAVGDTVTWTNNETDGTVHTITADGGGFSSGDVGPNASFSYTASSAGTLTYKCNYHPQTFGELRISGGNGEQPPPPPPPPPPSDDPPPPPESDPGPLGLLDGLLGLLP
ncbi:MAG: hypothetical protein ACRDTC_09115 [Pseudonocardiaceae bacterium]